MELPEPPAPRGTLHSLEQRPAPQRTHHLVIPCFNEATRLKDAQVSQLLADRRVSVVLVNDGSTDATDARLEALCRKERHASKLTLERNRGKAEAVRAGLLDAIGRGAPVVGYA